MPEVTIDYSKNEIGKARLALDAEEWLNAIHDYDQWLRDQAKYHDRDEMWSARERLHGYLAGRGLSLDDAMERLQDVGEEMEPGTLPPGGYVFDGEIEPWP